MIRVLVIDDSVTVRKLIIERLRTAGIEVVGEAADGSQAAELTRQLRPHVVLMDIVMPNVDGLAATRQIMSEIPTPIVVLTAYSHRQEIFRTYDALAAGALEVCAKPAGNESENEPEWDRILFTIRAAAQVPVTRLRPQMTPPSVASSDTFLPAAIGSTSPSRRIVVMGASTGGPAAVKSILGSLLPDFPLTILVAIHCSRRLSASVAEWFDSHCVLKVRDAQDGQRLSDLPETVITVPPGRHLRIRRGRMILDDDDSANGYAPCIDTLFTSAADDFGEATIGVLLTGIGADGAQGLKHIRDCGGSTIAQDEASCTVFGMPAAAVTLDAVEHVTPLHDIPRLLVQLAESASGVGALMEGH